MNPQAAIYLAVLMLFIANGFYWDHHGYAAATTELTAKIAAEREAATTAARLKEQHWQGAVDDIAKKHFADQKATQRNLDIALNSLRSRPERASVVSGTAEASAGDTGCSPKQLYRENAVAFIQLAGECEAVSNQLTAAQDYIKAVQP